MPWNNQSGGRGGGPWGSGPDRPNPWGNGPQRGGGGGGRDPNNPPDLEELLRKSQDRLRRAFPGKGGGGPGGGGGLSLGGLGGRGIALAVIVVLFIYGITGFYRVEQGEVGVELVFGSYQGTTQPGLNYNWPYPVGEVFTPDVLRVRETVIGTRGGSNGADVPAESLMLTGDENIVNVNYKAQWRISDPENFLFNIQDPPGTVKQVAESAMREVIGRRNLEPILTQDREQIELAVRELMQTTLDEYGAGIIVSELQLQKVDPPREVIDAFRDVQAARADQERLQNEARSYANRIVPEARGEAAQIVENATAYRAQVVAEAEGQADRFLSVYREYADAPDVTRQRIYLETLERVLRDTDNIVIDQAAGSGVVPYLPLDRLQNRNTAANASNNQGNR